jgi:hypothetical protein
VDLGNKSLLCHSDPLGYSKENSLKENSGKSAENRISILNTN